jgi:tetratricopeptide (TPR) repeat protein
MRTVRQRTWITWGWAVLLALVVAPAHASIESELAFHRGVAAYGEGRLTEARAEFEKVLAADPEDVAAHHYLGLIAQAQGTPALAVEHYRRALERAPDDLELRYDLGTALLEMREPAQALEHFEQVLARKPDHARAHLFAGIAEYRLRQHARAIEHLDEAVRLDPSLTAQASYYTGLAQAFLGDYPAATHALSAVEDVSPTSPLGTSAKQLREQLTPALPRPWSLDVTTGMEWDSNPFVVGEDQTASQDFRGILRVRGSYAFVRTEQLELRAGYEGYGSLHVDESEVDLQSHLGFLTASSEFGPLRLGLRYDFSHTDIDLDESFRRLHRLTPSITMSEGELGVTQLYYQYQDVDFLFDNVDPYIDRDGQEHVVGANQFVFLGDPVRYIWVGALFDHFDPAGPEFAYDGYELVAGVQVRLPWKLTFTADYRYLRRDFRNESFFSDPQFSTERDDKGSRVTAELVRPVNEHLEVSLAGSWWDNDSNVPTFDYYRTVIGAYVTVRF